MRFELGAAGWEAQMPALRTVPPFVTEHCNKMSLEWGMVQTVKIEKMCAKPQNTFFSFLLLFLLMLLLLLVLMLLLLLLLLLLMVLLLLLMVFTSD